MNKTNIEWVKNPDGSQGYTWNPMSGCENHTPEGLCKGGLFPCYAWKLAHTRLKQRYLTGDTVSMEIDDDKFCRSDAIADPFYPRFWEEKVLDLTTRRIRHHARDRRGVFVCDMGDLFGIGVPTKWTERVLGAITHKPNDRFYLLTKQPQNLNKFSPFPENAWVGVTVTSDGMMQPAYEALDCITAKVKYISLEPYLSPLGEANIKLLAGAEYYKWLDWLIIGACTGTYIEMVDLSRETRQEQDFEHIKPFGKKLTLQPKIEWVKAIVEAADKAGIPVFLKDNLKSLLVQEKAGNEYAARWANGGYGTLRQEMLK